MAIQHEVLHTCFSVKWSWWKQQRPNGIRPIGTLEFRCSIHLTYTRFIAKADMPMYDRCRGRYHSHVSYATRSQWWTNTLLLLQTTPAPTYKSIHFRLWFFCQTDFYHDFKFSYLNKKINKLFRICILLWVPNVNCPNAPRRFLIHWITLYWRTCNKIRTRNTRFSVVSNDSKSKKKQK